MVADPHCDEQTVQLGPEQGCTGTRSGRVADQVVTDIPDLLNDGHCALA